MNQKPVASFGARGRRRPDQPCIECGTPTRSRCAGRALCYNQGCTVTSCTHDRIACDLPVCNNKACHRAHKRSSNLNPSAVTGPCYGRKDAISDRLRRQEAERNAA